FELVENILASRSKKELSNPPRYSATLLINCATDSGHPKVDSPRSYLVITKNMCNVESLKLIEQYHIASPEQIIHMHFLEPATLQLFENRLNISFDSFDMSIDRDRNTPVALD